jgi:hypothetical protein
MEKEKKLTGIIQKRERKIKQKRNKNTNRKKIGETEKREKRKGESVTSELGCSPSRIVPGKVFIQLALSD